MLAMPIAVAEIADAVEAGLKERLEQLDLEQSVYGLDSLDELALHPIVAAALKAAGFGVHREKRYPADRAKFRVSEGERCDFVLTPDGRPLAAPDSTPTLFDPASPVPLDEAFWLEMKVVSQFTPDGPNRSYSSDLLSTVRHDVMKLAKDQGILRAALMIILFVQDQRVAEHDLEIWQNRCLERSLPIGAPSRRIVPINDRHGNSACAIYVYPVSHI